jgi:hypothetical protein
MAALLDEFRAIRERAVVVLYGDMTQFKDAESAATILERGFASDGDRAQRFHAFERDTDRPSTQQGPHSSSIPRRINTSRVGRRPAGPNGERTSTYPQISARLPPSTLARVRELSRSLRVPQCRILADALDAYLERQALNRGERRQAPGTPNQKSETLAGPIPSDIAADRPRHDRLTPPSNSFGPSSSASPMQAILDEERPQNIAAEPNPVIRKRS